MAVAIGGANGVLQHLSTDAIPRDERVAWFLHEIARHIPGTRATPLDSANGFAFRWQFLPMSDGGIARISMSGALCERGERELRDGADGLGLIMPLDGTLCYVLDGVECRCSAGEWGMFPNRLTSRGEWWDYDAILINLPRAVLRDADFEHHPTMRLTGAAALMLTAYVEGLWRAAETGERAPAFATRHLGELVAAAVNSEDAARQDVREVRRLARIARIREAIARRYAEPGLSMASIAGDLACSPRSAYNALAADGLTFAGLLLATRLDRARDHLADSMGRRVVDIALDCGFAELSHFNRRFRERFGMTPGAWRDCVSLGLLHGQPDGSALADKPPTR